MDDDRKTAYVAAGVVLFFGIIILVVAFDAEKMDRIIVTMGAIFTGLGGLGIWKPEVGEVIAHWFKNAGENNQRISQRQRSTKPKNSPQAMAGRDLHMHNYYGKNQKDGKNEK